MRDSSHPTCGMSSHPEILKDLRTSNSIVAAIPGCSEEMVKPFSMEKVPVPSSPYHPETNFDCNRSYLKINYNLPKIRYTRDDDPKVSALAALLCS